MSHAPSKSDSPAEPTDALRYHCGGARPGKLEIRATKPMATQLDLSLAYSPGVAEPCRAIAADKERVFDYTARGNLVAVVTNGSAVLGLGNIGPEAAKPVMEGKAVLFKRFADIDVFDLEVDGDADTVIQVVKALAPTFGGINLEDIRAPEAFRVEETLQEALDIPVFHDDQHGTAIISGAALLNALELTGKRIEHVRVAVAGAGAAAIACIKLWIELGVDPANVLMADHHGLLTTDREDVMTDPWRRRFARGTGRRTLAEAMVGADVFLGLSVGGIVSKAMVASMASEPVVFALANPDPEITYPDVKAACPDAIVATGRTDFPNQVNNVLGFPFIFRGALDVRAKGIDGRMKIAAVRAIAALAREPVPATVSRAYGGENFTFGPDYIIPKPFDTRVLGWVAPAVARAAMDSGIARKPIVDWDAYGNHLERMMDPGRGFVRLLHGRARSQPKRIVFAEGSDKRVVKAAAVLAREGLAKPVLMGLRAEVEEAAAELGVDLTGVETVYPKDDPRFDRYLDRYLRARRRKGMTAERAVHDMLSRTNFGLMMVREGDADGAVLGATRAYAQAIRPALSIVGTSQTACGLYLVMTAKETLFFADTTVNVNPTAEQLRDITLSTVKAVRTFQQVPRVALVSFANFGAVKHDDTVKMARAVEMVRREDPTLMIEGEMQVDVALDMDLRERIFPWSQLTERANVFIFPNLAASNIAYKLMHQAGGASIFGPILLGMSRPVNILALNADATDIVNLAAYTVVEAQESGALPMG